MVVSYSTLWFSSSRLTSEIALGDVFLEQDRINGQEMLVWLAERGTKTRKGQDKGHQRAFKPKIYATGTERCPVKFYKLFKSHSPAEMNLPDAPFFLAVRHGERKQNNNVWYMKAPLGKNGVGKFFSKAAEKAGIQVPGSKISNHSVRKTCISRLLDGNTPEKFVAQLSGHQNIVSLQSYKSASEQHQRGMSRSRQSSSLRMESSQVFARSASQPLCSPPAKQQDETLLQISEAT